MSDPIEIRFLNKVDYLPNGCWLWTAGKNNGYGTFCVNGTDLKAHRWSYAHWVGPIPDDMDMDHFRFPQDGCIGPSCVNPDHVRPTTTRENVLRSNNVTAWCAARSHCPHGHPYAGSNLYIAPNGGRYCRTCKRISHEKQPNRPSRPRLTLTN